MDKTFRIRLAVCFLVVLAFGLAVVGRSAYLMLMPSERLQAAVARQFRHDGPPVLPRRGKIVDRFGEALAVSLDVKSLYANPRSIDNKNFVAQQLAGILRLPLTQVRARLKEKRGFVWVKRHVTDEEAASLQRWLDKHHAAALSVGLVTESKRSYPNQNLASTLLGFTNIDSKGIEGLELQYDQELSGRKLQGPNSAEANTLVLTIDKALQNVLERELEAGIARTGAKSASSIVMDADTGDILAMGSYPNFNPNLPQQTASEFHRNRLVTDTYEPGSTVKPILVAGALEAKAVTTTQKVFCEYGKFQVGKHWIREAEAKDKWGWLRVDEVVQKSSNVGATKIGFLFGSEPLYKWYKQQGLTVKTGIELPGEVTGTLPPFQEWGQIHLSNISFGQGISVTALQLVRAYAAMANGGHWIKPRLLQEIKNYEGESLRRLDTEALDKTNTVMQAATAKTIQQVMSKVATADGTAPKAAIPGFQILGKTGTAQKAFPGMGYRSGKYIASFVGFARGVSPRYVTYVMVDEPKFPYFGGEAAAPIFKNIMSAALARAGAAPDPALMPKETAPLVQPLRLGHKATPPPAGPAILVEAHDGLKMPNLIGSSAREVMNLFDKRPVELKLSGSGVVVEQFPAAGTSFQKGDRVSVRLDQNSRL